MSRENRRSPNERSSRKPKGLKQKRGIFTKSSFREVQRHIKDDHVIAARALRRLYEKENKSHRQLTWKMAAWAYELALHLNSGERWASFAAELFWRGHSRLNHEHVLRYSLIYLYGSHQDETIVNRARDHARCLERLWDAGAKPREVYAALKQHGFSGLKQSTENSPRAEGTFVSRSFLTGPNGRRNLDRLVEGQKALIEAEVALRGGKRIIRIVRVRPRQVVVDKSPATCRQRDR